MPIDPFAGGGPVPLDPMVQQIVFIQKLTALSGPLTALVAGIALVAAVSIFTRRAYGG